MEKKEFPKALNQEGYTYSLEGVYTSRAACQVRFRELLRDELPGDARYRIIKRLDPKWHDFWYGLYIW